MYIISYAGFDVKLILTTDVVKLEILSTKSETNSKCECSNDQNEGRGTEGAKERREDEEMRECGDEAASGRVRTD